MTATGWFKEFDRRTNNDRQLNKLYNVYQNREIPESEWTKAIAEVLVKMAKAYRYRVVKESKVPIGKRADQRWLKGKRSAVVIEHENRPSPLDAEIEKLCNDVSKLKVLITYAADTNFESRARKIAHEVQDAINGHIGTFTGTFLLIVGGYVESDWMAFRSLMKVEVRQILRINQGTRYEHPGG